MSPRTQHTSPTEQEGTDFVAVHPDMDFRTVAADEARRAFSIPEFCRRYGIGRSKVYEEIKAGRLIAVKAGHRTLIREEDAEKWLRSLPIKPGGIVTDGAVVATNVLPKNAARNVTPRVLIYRKDGTR